MLDWLRQRRQRAERDRFEAEYMLKTHGPDAIHVLRKRASAEDLDERSRRHWMRIGRIVARQLDP